MPEKVFFEVFQEQLKTLHLQEFPCGPGSWKSKYLWSTDTNFFSEDKTGTGESAEVFPAESLCDLIHSDTFTVDNDLGEDVVTLRTEAIKSDQPLSDSWIWQKFSALRLVDKEITAIDDRLTNFKNLKELILSVNKITSIDGRHLPAKLEVLELCGNQINNLRSLNSCTCPLLHLGLSHNQVTTIENQLDHSRWKALVSLDLSCNGISTLPITMSVLQNLPKLRNLALEGNPVSLASGYRGFIVDSLKGLMILDGKRISADEKHYYRGISKLTGFNPDTTVFRVEICKLTGVKARVRDESEGDLFPVKDYRYQISYQFVEGIVSLMNAKEEQSPEDSEPTCLIIEDIQTTGKEPGKAIIPVPECHWQEEIIDVGYTRSLAATNLKLLNDFLKTKVDINLTEHCVLVGKEAEILEGVKESTHLTNGQDKELNTTRVRKLPKTTLPSHFKDTKGKSRVKDKQEEQEYYEISRETRMIGKSTMDLSAFIQGECLVSAELTFDEVEIVSCEPSHLTMPLEVRQTNGKSLGESKKRRKDSVKSSILRVGTAGSVRGKSALATKNSKNDRTGKGKETKKSTIQQIFEEGEAARKSAVTVKVELLRWKTAKEVYDWIKTLPQDCRF